MTQLELTDLAALGAALTGRLVLPGDADYDAMRAGFNAMIDRRPAAIARVRDDRDVAHAIRFARENDLPLAIRAGGHSAPGHGCCDGGIVIDCRELRSMAVDRRTGLARCGSGLTWRQFDASTQEHGLAVTGGRVSSTGVTGLTIGSGSGWLERSMGLTSDRLIGARLVTADGVVVDTAQDPDLLWALRGGGGNFGVITELRFALAPLGPTVVGGIRMFPFERAAGLLRSYRDIMSRAPRELCGGIALLTAPPAPFVPRELRGRPVVGLIVLWAGDVGSAGRGLAPLQDLGRPAVDQVGPMPYTELQRLMDQGAPPGHRDYFKGGFITAVSDEAIDAIVEIGRDLRAPLTQIICAPLGEQTAYAEVGEEHSAIGHRGEQWSFQVLSLWSDPAQDAEQKAWTRAAAESMSSYSEMVSYPNFLTADEPADVERAFSPSAMERLRAVKRRYDPDNVFRLNNNILPAPSPEARDDLQSL
ncbi:MAG TPA: FAD-binding oxidoreductase [Solirubrobacteraceae bacterium]|nr:FAD-binding oxidoreductase [Solirubrobacteraceae bacterium]